MLEVLIRGSYGGTRFGAGAVVIEAKLAGEGLRSRDSVVDLHELDGSKAAAGRDNGNGRGHRWRRRRGRWCGTATVLLCEKRGGREGESEDERDVGA